MRRGAKPSKAKVESSRSAAPRSKNEGSRVTDLEKQLAEALKREAEAQEQQAATAKILQVISQSPTDVTPIFDTIVESAWRLCAATRAAVYRFDGSLVHFVAHHGYSAEALAIARALSPSPPDRSRAATRAIVDRTVVHIPDVFEDTEHRQPDLARAVGVRSLLGVPMLRDGEPLGAVFVGREAPGPFSRDQIALLQTFADQAVIAIENVRLFNELQEKNRALTQAHAQVTEALEQQTATSEILRVISQSPTDIQPVLDAVAESAARLCESFDAVILRRDGDRLVLVAHHGPVPFGPIGEFSFPLIRGNVTGRTVLDGHAIHLADLQSEAEEFPQGSQFARERGFRTALSVPLMREGVAIGTINLRRTEAQLFTDRQVVLLETFADQAVIAIENVRLFTELQTSNRDLTKALDTQTATSDILGVISRSQTDVQPVFDAIVASALRLLRAYTGALTRVEGDQIVLVALTSTDAAADAVVRAAFPQSLQSAEPHPLVAREGRPLNIADAHTDSRLTEAARAFALAREFRSWVLVPLLRQAEAVGAIGVTRRQPGGFTDDEIALLQTFADQAVIAIENVRLFKKLEARNRDLTATGEILRVISTSPTDVRPVFEAIITSAVNLCRADGGILVRIEGGLIQRVTGVGPHPEARESVRRFFPRPIDTTTTFGQAILQRRVVQLPDTESPASPPAVRDAGRLLGFRAELSVPMLRDSEPIGAIAVTRGDPGQFSTDEVQLLQTFADQAVIAIDNVRLFTELRESLEQQTATAEILRVISSSPTDVQPVFESIGESVVRLMGAAMASVYEFDGTLVHLRTLTPPTWPHAEELRRQYPRPPDARLAAGRVILERAILHLADLQTDPETPSVTRQVAERMGLKGVLWIPMLREGTPIGVIGAVRGEAGLFSEKQVRLLQTFADQAVIAIENVRLFKELEEKNRALTQAHAQVTESLEQQTATAEILRVISSSPTDVQPVFDEIAMNARRLLRGHTVTVTRLRGNELELMSYNTTSPAADAVMREFHPIILDRVPMAARTVRERTPAIVNDIETDPAVTEEQRDVGRARGFRSFVYMPMVRDDVAIGCIAVTRQESGLFTERDIALLKTFADQAVIAIENVRLFNETKEALERQTATSEILQVISSSPTDVQPVFETIARSATTLCEAELSHLYRFDGGLIHFAAQHGGTPAETTAAQRAFPQPPSRLSVTARAILTAAIVQVADVSEEPEVADSLRMFRTVLSVPMLRDRRPLGAITVARRIVRPFTAKQIDLLKTFADQAVIAIENVRLFTELQARTQELTRSVGQLTALGEVARAVSSTLDLEAVLNTIVSRAIQLSGTDGGSVYEYDEATEEFSLRASRDLPEAYVEQVRDARPRKGEGAVGRVAQTREPVQIADISDAAAYESRVRNILLRMGLRALLAVPLIAEDRLVGALIVMRKRTGTFAAEEVALLQTFATQSALAIQNARLFREIEEKSRQLEVASQHKSEFLANMSHELRTPLNAVIGFSEVLSERMFGELNEKQDEYLKDIHASGQHLLSLINDILDLSKIEAGRMELEVTDFALPVAIDNALTLVRERAARRSIALHMTVDERLGQIQGDERKVRQVLLNLLSNAIKFTPEGGRIDVEAKPVDGSIQVSVSDTGVGIAPEDQEAVFEEFKQVGTADKKVEGTGLGLALSRKFIELHGGKIWLKSQAGAGSTFTFSIPVRRGE